jgi:hypothetical protein
MTNKNKRKKGAAQRKGEAKQKLYKAYGALSASMRSALKEDRWSDFPRQSYKE